MEIESILDYDELKLMFGDDYVVNKYIVIHQPKIGEIVVYGEKEYYAMIHLLTCIPSDMKSLLFDMGIDYEAISDFDLFYIMTRQLGSDKTKILFGDNIDLSRMQLKENLENSLKYLFDPKTGCILDSYAYLRISDYLRKLHGIKSKVERAATKTVKEILINIDREKILKQMDKKYTYQLKSLISAMMRYPGFKYKLQELRQCGLYEFMDAVRGSQIYIQSTSLLQGSYSGMIDTSKIDKKEFDWTRSVDD